MLRSREQFVDLDTRRLQAQPQPTYGGRKMAQENRETIAAVLAAGIMGSGKFALRADADTAVDLYQHCLESLDRQAEREASEWKPK